MPFIEHGEKDGNTWTIQCRKSVDNRFYALVTLNGKNTLTHNTYRTEPLAVSAGIALLKTLSNGVCICQEK